jgi:hypothetical protein
MVIGIDKRKANQVESTGGMLLNLYLGWAKVVEGVMIELI